ncbi:hypothetical protein F5Y08DRAFT_316745 [Xylaria arbuscula]|nr:hypothetical protein F5Y08DRAFT_316745 [Xylaria arbuscula]
MTTYLLIWLSGVVLRVAPLSTQRRLCRTSRHPQLKGHICPPTFKRGRYTRFVSKEAGTKPLYCPLVILPV